MDQGGFTKMAFTSDGVQYGGYVVTVPKAVDISDSDKALRKVTGITFTGWLAGAIHLVEINGVVTY
jgi:hypothetical protein